MENLNPYDPPLSESHDIGDINPSSVDTITSRFSFTSQHLIDTLTRFRSQHSGRRLWRWLRWVAAFIFVLVAIAGLFIPQYFASAFMVALAIFAFFPHKIDDYLATRNFRRSPHCNAQQIIHLSDDGFRAESEIEQTDLKWAAFSKAVIFSDGVLLYRGPKMVNWIPDATLDSTDGPFRIRKLLTEKLPTNHVVNRSDR
ncbi:YcxB family protein [Rubripirellula reticaptiva]|nr:YcxB family protein [Rubripirellula reticaptiva]